MRKSRSNPLALSMTPHSLTDFLRFVVGLAYTERSTLRAGDLLNLREDLAFWCGQKGWVAICDSNHLCYAMTADRPIASVSVEDFERLHVALRGIVEQALVPTEPMPLPPTITMGLFPDGVEQSLPGRKLMTLTGPLVDVIAATTQMALFATPVQRLGRCPECATVFVKIKHQHYCSRNCSVRVNMRTYLARQRQAEEAGEALPAPAAS